MADEAELGTFVAAAQVVGVVPATVRSWVRRGELGAPPWSRAQVEAAAALPRAAAVRPRGTVLTGHGSNSRYHGACRCASCRRAHAEVSTAWRGELRRAFWAEREDRLCRLVAAGESLRDACVIVGASIQGAARFQRADPGFRQRLDDALMMGRDPDLPHGRSAGWRAGCRCPECRAVHDASR